MKQSATFKQYEFLAADEGTLDMLKSLEKLGWYTILDIRDFHTDEFEDAYGGCWTQEQFTIVIDHVNLYSQAMSEVMNYIFSNAFMSTGFYF